MAFSIRHPLRLAACLAIVPLLCMRGMAAEPAAPSSQSHSWTFESGEDGWQARSKTLLVRQVSGPGATPESRGTLRIQGQIQDGWNYALSRHVPIKGDSFYRLTAWVRVDQAGSNTPAPFLKCELMGPPEKRNLGQIGTTHYDLARPGTWQLLEAEFPAPPAVQSCWLALEKGTERPTEIDARLDDIRLEQIPRLTLLEQYRLTPLPPALEKNRGSHPRLYLDPARITDLRKAITNTHAPLWAELREQANDLVRRGPPAYREQDGHSGDEQLWQREVGNAMPFLAMAWVLTHERQYLDAARQWALASCGYKTWGLGRIDGMDLATGHQLFGLAIVYDWCHADLDEPTRATLRNTLVRRTTAMFEAAASNKAWWSRSYLQNHLWVNVCGMAATGIALFDEVEDASFWIGLPLEKFKKTMSILGPDGASHEGVGYWEYGAEYLLKFMDLARSRLGVDLYQTDWWRHTALYAQHLQLPRGAWTRSSCIVDIADCPRGHWYGPDYMLRHLAGTFRDGHAQWLAHEIDQSNVAAPGASWLNLLWFDTSVQATPPSNLPTLRHFDDMGIVSARTDWSGTEALSVFKCGPFVGHHAIQQFTYDPGGGHVHPDANHFVLFGAGEWLIRDDGYRAKWTAQHNTLLVDGEGQFGEGSMWFDGSLAQRVKSRPRILRAEFTPALDRITGDATSAYPPSLGVRRFVRHLLFLKPDVLLICDDILVDTPRELELRFHPENKVTTRDHHAFVFQGKRSVLRLELLTPDQVILSAEDIAAGDRQGNKTDKLFTVRLHTRANAWRNVTALSWCPSGQKPKQIRLESQGASWQFSCEGRRASLEW